MRMLFSQKNLFNIKHVEIGKILTGYKTYFVRPGHLSPLIMDLPDLPQAANWVMLGRVTM